LDGLRAIAILLVIGCHYQAFAAPLRGLLKFGWVGVDVFFVLSGFLITSILLKAKGSPGALRRFYERRCRRILPPLLIALTLYSIGCLLSGDRSFFSIPSLVKNGLFLQAFTNSKALFSGLAGHRLTSLQVGTLPPAADGIAGPMSASASILWSLSIEEYFYLLWAPVVLWLSRRGITLVACSICVAEFMVRWLCFSGRGDYFSIFYRFDALIYGAMLALAMDSIARNPGAARWWLSATLAASLAVLSGTLLMIRPILGLEIRASAPFMVVGLPMISITVASLVGLLVLKAGSLDPSARFLRSWPMRSVGTISYTLYLVHIFFYLVLTRTLGAGLLGAVGSTLAAMLFATVSWKLVEAPILGWKSQPQVRETA
jgi:peptidoglycan/LPS O-acetylase OafA/YrhL